jgi:CheY-like chemotaxis protein
VTPPLERILYVDDEPFLRTVTRAALTKLGGFTVELAESGADALIKAPLFRPDLILLDVMMPVMDGPATLLQLRADPAIGAIPVVFFTAKAQPQEIARFRALGAADVLTKPYEPRELCANLRAIWATLHKE